MKKTAYISAPITGRPDYAVNKVFSSAEVELVKMGYSVKNPLKIAKKVDEKTNEAGRTAIYEEYIANDMLHLLISDVVYFCRGWHESKGCQLEFAAAKIYDKEIIFE